jgi:hypothetical protein
MEASFKHSRTRASFRFQPALMERLKIEAKRNNVSVNSFVETMLSDMLYFTPNETTVGAMKETLSGKYAGVSTPRQKNHSSVLFSTMKKIRYSTQFRN